MKSKMAPKCIDKNVTKSIVCALIISRLTYFFRYLMDGDSVTLSSSGGSIEKASNMELFESMTSDYVRCGNILDLKTFTCHLLVFSFQSNHNTSLLDTSCFYDDYYHHYEPNQSID